MFRDLTGHTCVKKTNYDLVNFYNYRDEFRYTDIVILSGGINDISRNGHSAESLADIFFGRLAECARLYPDTRFIVNTMLWTEHQYFNDHIDRFNRYLFEFCNSGDFNNVFYFNSHNYLSDNLGKISGSVYDRSDVNGIHIVFQATRLVGDGLVRFVKQNCTDRSGTSYTSHGAWRPPHR